MEPGFYLTALVFAVAALHLITRGVSLFHRNTKVSRPGMDKSANKRSDWYMFFHCSDLTGEKKQTTVSNRNDSNKSISRGKNKVKDIRPALRSNLA